MSTESGLASCFAWPTVAMHPVTAAYMGMRDKISFGASAFNGLRLNQEFPSPSTRSIVSLFGP